MHACFELQAMQFDLALAAANSCSLCCCTAALAASHSWCIASTCCWCASSKCWHSSCRKQQAQNVQVVTVLFKAKQCSAHAIECSKLALGSGQPTNNLKQHEIDMVRSHQETHNLNQSDIALPPSYEGGKVALICEAAQVSIVADASPHTCAVCCVT